jgi:hypothetical protein
LGTFISFTDPLSILNVDLDYVMQVPTKLTEVSNSTRQAI